MIDLYFWTTPNGYKIKLFLEEAGLDHRIVPVNISRGEQFRPEFLAISPNNRIPAIVDHDPEGGGEALAIFESGAILQYLAEKSGKFLPTDQRARAETLQWLNWQMGGLGPMLGQNNHFGSYAPERIPYAIKRYRDESERLYGVLDKHLAGRDFVAGGAYSIADMAIYPWIRSSLAQFGGFANVRRWHDAIALRPATVAAYEKGRAINTVPTVTEASKKFLLGQTASRAA